MFWSCLKKDGVTETNYKTDGIEKAIGGSPGNRPIQNAIADLVQQVLGYTVKEETGGQKKKDITAQHDPSASSGDKKVHVTIQDSSTQTNKAEGATGSVLQDNNKVTITIKVVGDPSGKETEADKMLVIVILVYLQTIRTSLVSITIQTGLKTYRTQTQINWYK